MEERTNLDEYSEEDDEERRRQEDALDGEVTGQRRTHIKCNGAAQTPVPLQVSVTNHPIFHTPAQLKYVEFQLKNDRY